MPLDQFRPAVLLFLTLGFYMAAWGQMPPNRPEQDCISAIPVCQNFIYQPLGYSGRGADPNEINGASSCLNLGEQNSVWYVMNIQTGGSLCFTLTPDDSLDDYDWALYNLTNYDCYDIRNVPSLEVACNFVYNDGSCNGQTGANGITACPQNEPCVNVNAGETYVLVVSNFTASPTGYSLDFSASTAQLFDNVQPVLDSVSSYCTIVRAYFSEPILCASVTPADWVFTGPGGPYTISQVRSPQCDNGGGYSTWFDLWIDPKVPFAGLYNIALAGQVNDLCGNGSNPANFDVYMDLPPIAAFSVDVPNSCAGEEDFIFNYTGPSQVVSYRWDFGDGSGSVLADPIHQYQQPGIMPVELIITDDKGCRDTLVQDITVAPSPEAAMDVDATSCSGYPLPFTDVSTPGAGAITEWLWDFGDTQTSNQRNPAHQYSRAGIYRVRLTVTDADGCTDSLSQVIRVFSSPDTRFDPGPTTCEGDTSFFLNQTTLFKSVNNDSIIDWSWDFGDGSAAGMDLAPFHIYGAAGQYPVTLIVETNLGCADTLTLIKEVHDAPLPVLLPDTVCPGEEAFLEAFPIDNGGIAWYEDTGSVWPFQTVPVFETNPLWAPLTFWVEAISIEGCVSERVPITADLHILGLPFIAASDTTPTLPNAEVSFSVGGADGLFYSWDFGDGNTSTEENPVHRYSKPGTYQVKLELTGQNGCQYTLHQEIYVENPSRLYVPTAFSPNNDGVNERWTIFVESVGQYRLQVFDRLGDLVFESNQPGEEWDGRGLNGQALPEGVYVFTLEAIDEARQGIRERGTVTLLR